MSDDRDESRSEELRRSWIENADGWADVVRNQRIESRRLVTDAAIIGAVLEQRPHTALDLGCGEGWLTRALTEQGIAVTGVDASAPLIAAAEELGGAKYLIADYDDLLQQNVTLSPVDVIVANFSLLDERTSDILAALAPLLNEKGCVVVQTTHPLMTVGDAPYADGWRTETFATFPGQFPTPMPWFFRTISSWIRVFASAGYVVTELREPLHPQTARPASLLFLCRRSARI